jgi:tRNA (guanine37-N1)-methyltransferase
MKFEIVTLFPEYFSLSLKQSLLGKGVENGLFDIGITQLRDFATDKHRTVDDTPFGGGGGMVMKAEPLDACLNHLGLGKKDRKDTDVLALTSAAGAPFDQETAVRYSLAERVTIVCGHYLGVDERILELYDFEEVSIGDYVLTGGEPAAAVIVDAVARLIPGVLGNMESALEDSYMNQLIGSPCYTRPAEYKGLKVPEVLLSGNHSEIKRFRRAKAVERCFDRRPDLLARADLSAEDLQLIDELKRKKDE